MIVSAIIPARGGSKGIPLKNLANVCGKPLLSYTVEAALRAPEVSEVLVSTDSGQIAEVAESCGARVVRRPPELSGDLEPAALSPPQPGTIPNPCYHEANMAEQTTARSSSIPNLCLINNLLVDPAAELRTRQDCSTP